MKTIDFQHKSIITDSYTQHDGHGIYINFRFTEPVGSNNPLIPVLTLTKIANEAGQIIKEYIPECNIKSSESANVPWHPTRFPDGTNAARILFETVFIVNQSIPDYVQIQNYLSRCSTFWSVRGLRGKGRTFRTFDYIFLTAKKTELRMRKVVLL